MEEWRVFFFFFSPELAVQLPLCFPNHIRPPDSDRSGTAAFSTAKLLLIFLVNGLNFQREKRQKVPSGDESLAA